MCITLVGVMQHCAAVTFQLVALDVQEMTFKAQRLGPEIIAVSDSFLQSSNMAVD